MYADREGRSLGSEVLAGRVGLPEAVVYSQTPLNIEAEGVVETQLSANEGEFRYRYSGLQFLVLSNHRYFLLPEELSEETVCAIILAESETIRIEVMVRYRPRA